MNAVFLDTVGLVALWNNSDQWHDAAKMAFAQIVRERRRIVTTTFVLLECGNAAARRPYRHEPGLLSASLQHRNELIVPTDEDWDDAWREYNAGNAGDAGIVDHVSFVVMKRLGLTTAFTNDKHFKAAGFITLF